MSTAWWKPFLASYTDCALKTSLGVSSSTTTSRSISLSGPASPRATDPNTITRCGRKWATTESSNWGGIKVALMPDANSFDARGEAAQPPLGRLFRRARRDARALRARVKGDGAEPFDPLAELFRAGFQRRPVDNQARGDIGDMFDFDEAVRLQGRAGLHQIDDMP